MKSRQTSLDRFRRDLTARNLRPRTIDAYVRCVVRFVEHLDRPPSRARESDVRDYIVEYQQDHAPRSVNQAIAALRCFYTETLRRPNLFARVQYVREEHPLPTILSGTEIKRLLDAIESAKHRALFLLMYSAGLRVSEACALRIDSIDSKRMTLRIPHAKGRPRDVPMGVTLLHALRAQYVAEHPPGPWLFPGRGTGRPITHKAVRGALAAIREHAGVTKRVTPHGLRHAYATHLMDTGADLRTLQVLLGHASLRSTLYYTRLSRVQLTATPSPVELLGTPAGRVLG